MDIHATKGTPVPTCRRRGSRCRGAWRFPNRSPNSLSVYPYPSPHPLLGQESPPGPGSHCHRCFSTSIHCRPFELASSHLQQLFSCSSHMEKSMGKMGCARCGPSDWGYGKGPSDCSGHDAHCTRPTCCGHQPLDGFLHCTLVGNTFGHAILSTLPSRPNFSTWSCQSFQLFGVDISI